jgi:hypothetical protein
VLRRFFFPPLLLSPRPKRFAGYLSSIREYVFRRGFALLLSSASAEFYSPGTGQSGLFLTTCPVCLRPGILTSVWLNPPRSTLCLVDRGRAPCLTCLVGQCEGRVLR